MSAHHCPRCRLTWAACTCRVLSGLRFPWLGVGGG
jgi:hypothetical protein